LAKKPHPCYGGRGITVCDEWKNDFMVFYTWATKNGYNEKLTIDRIDNDGNYEPNNCRWVARGINCQNKRLIQKNNTSGYRGVYRVKESKRWMVICTYCNVSHKVGWFNTAVEGAIAYDQFVIDNNLPYPLNILKRE